jgi:hypothetical protein
MRSSRIPVTFFAGAFTLFAIVGLLAVSACSKPAQPQPAQAAASEPGAPAAGQPTGTAAQPAGAPPAAPAAPAKPVPPPPPPPRKSTIPEGMVIAIQTNYALSTETQKAGDKFEASLASAIVDGDWVIAKEGADVDGLVVAATKGGKVKGRAELEVAVTGLTLADGQHIKLATELAKTTADSSKKKDAGRIAITTGVGMAIGAIAGGGKGVAIGAVAGGAGGTALVLGTRGKPAEIPARSLLQFQVTRPVEVVEKR